jgi:hypothetical protein
VTQLPPGAPSAFVSITCKRRLKVQAFAHGVDVALIEGFGNRTSPLEPVQLALEGPHARLHLPLEYSDVRNVDAEIEQTHLALRCRIMELGQPCAHLLGEGGARRDRLLCRGSACTLETLNHLAHGPNFELHALESRIR